MPLLVYILLAVILTAVATWLLSQSMLRKSVVPFKEEETLKAEINALKSELAVKTQMHGQALEDCRKETARAESMLDNWQEAGRQHTRATADCDSAKVQLAEVKEVLIQTQKQLEAKRAELSETEKETAKLKAENSHCLQKLAEQEQFVKDTKVSMEGVFKSIAQDTLTANSQKISEQQKEKLENTLLPFREQIEAFRKQVDEKFNAEVADRNTLKGELSKVFQLTNDLTDQTNQLSRALTSSNKTQGNWGEDILLTILQNAGMIEGEHFEKQFNTRNEDGQRVIPDIVIKCPDNYSLVVDSKVSLTHYVRYCQEGLTPEEERGLRREIYNSFKGHIDGLSGKKYESIAHCADFVLLFAPIESAFTVAAQHDSDIRNYAFQKKVFLVTPSNLLLVVKMIGDLWQQDRVSREAQDMADRAQKLYEKACSFLDSFTSMGNALGKAQEQFDKATGQLTGSGGLVRQGELLKGLLGKSTSKAIPDKLLEITSKAESEVLISGNPIALS